MNLFWSLVIKGLAGLFDAKVTETFHAAQKDVPRCWWGRDLFQLQLMAEETWIISCRVRFAGGTLPLVNNL